MEYGSQMLKFTYFIVIFEYCRDTFTLGKSQKKLSFSSHNFSDFFSRASKKVFFLSGLAFTPLLPPLSSRTTGGGTFFPDSLAVRQTERDKGKLILLRPFWYYYNQLAVVRKILTLQSEPENLIFFGKGLLSSFWLCAVKDNSLSPIQSSCKLVRMCWAPCLFARLLLTGQDIYYRGQKLQGNDTLLLHFLHISSL